ncbi:OmpA family protein [Pedobacter nutrimenti]|uniref:OmpA family protein n=1 Tax=Pedobacter nutrimenti TaxID=1241337 RepID=UPI00292F1FB8|nr:OmpA family protein [Pedobacter nutrimenti]
MPKGPKRIDLVAGEYYYKKASNGNVIVLTPNVAHAFEVVEWYPGTTEAQKNSVTWLYEDAKRTKILMISKTGAPSLRALSVPKKLCGNVPMYYLEASLTGTIDLNVKTGLLVRGICDPLIVKSTWSKSYKGENLGKTPINFGDDVHLNVQTEGLNGHRLTIKVYKRQAPLKDKDVDVFSNVLVENGEINLQIRNTYNWYADLKYGPDVQELYVKITDNQSGVLVKDSFKQEYHGRYLRLKNKVSTSAVATPLNLTVAKVGPPAENLKQPDHCKFTKIEISDIGNPPIPIFDEGKIKLKGSIDSEFYLDEKINYEFDSYKVRNEDKKKLDKIAEILMKIAFIPVELGSHTDRFGTPEYNMALSEKRAKAAVEYLISKNVDASRITAKGYGKTQLLNADEKLSKQDSVVNRRTTIKLKIFTHNAMSMEYETIGPGKSKARDLPIRIYSFTTDGLCNFPSRPHHRYVPYGELVPKKEAQALKLDGNETIHPKIYSPLDERTHAYDYIWPMARSYNSFFYYINSCRYFSNQDKHSLVVKTYSDIKWTLSFFLNLTNDLSVKWQNLPPAEHKAMQKKAGKEGAERRWEQKDASFGFSLTSDWNNSGGKYSGHDEFKKEHEGKFKKLYSLFSSLNAIADGVTNITKGSIREVGLKGIPIKFEVKPPNMSLNATWMLERAKKDHAPIAKIGTGITIDFQAHPLIGLTITIDLLGAIVALGAAAVSGGSASKPALEFYQMLKSKLKTGLKLGNDDVGFKANMDVFMDLIIKNEIQTDVGFHFNTVSAAKEDTFKIEATNKLQVALKAGVFIKGELSMMVVKINGYFEAKAGAIASVTFGHGVYYDQKGLYYKPKLGFDGMDADYVITASAGLAIKKGIPQNEIVKDQEGKWEIAKGKFDGIVPKFDVIESLEAVTGVSIEVPLMRS